MVDAVGPVKQPVRRRHSLSDSSRAATYRSTPHMLFVIGIRRCALPAVVQLLAQGRRVDAAADHDELGAPLLALRPRRGVEAQEVTDGVHRELLAVLRYVEVDEALDAVEAGRAAVEEVHQPARVHRLGGGELHALVGGVEVARMVGVVGVAARVRMVAVVVRAVGGVLVRCGVAQQVLEGQLAHGRVVVLARPAVEEQLGIDPPVCGADHGPAGGEVRERVHEVLARRVADAIGLVEHHDVGDAHMPVQFGVPVPGVLELRGVDDLDQPAVDDPVVVAGEDHADEFLRLGQPTGLDDDHVDTGGGAGEPLQVGVQFAGVDRAAQTAVAERDHRVHLAGDGHGVDLDAAEVIDDRTDTGAVAGAEQMVEERGLARSEEAREHDDRDLLRGQGSASMVRVAGRADRRRTSCRS